MHNFIDNKAKSLYNNTCNRCNAMYINSTYWVRLLFPKLRRADAEITGTARQKPGKK